MSSMMIHMAGGHRLEEADLRLLPEPENTSTHHPVPFHVLHEMTQHRLEKEFPTATIESDFGLNKQETQIFALYNVRDHTGPGDTGKSVAFRSSTDKSLQPTWVGGVHVFICDNMMLTGDLLKVCRKQTQNSAEDIHMCVLKICAQLEDHYQSTLVEIDLLRDIEVEERNGYGILGQLYGTGVVTANQCTRAFRAWKKPEQADFKPRTAWSLYNAVTESLKNGSPGTLMGAYMKLHDDFRRRFVYSWEKENLVRSSDDEIIDIN